MNNAKKRELLFWIVVMLGVVVAILMTAGCESRKVHSHIMCDPNGQARIYKIHGYNYLCYNEEGTYRFRLIYHNLTVDQDATADTTFYESLSFPRYIPKTIILQENPWCIMIPLEIK